MQFRTALKPFGITRQRCGVGRSGGWLRFFSRSPEWGHWLSPLAVRRLKPSPFRPGEGFEGRPN